MMTKTTTITKITKMMTKNLTLYLGADHRGFELKEQLKAWLEQEKKLTVVDCGNTVYDPKDDFPDYALIVAEKVAQANNSTQARGIVICGSGVGASIAANKVDQAYASLVLNPAGVRHAAERDGLNVLVLSADETSLKQAQNLIEAFLKSKPKNKPRFVRRRRKIKQYEAQT